MAEVMIQVTKTGAVFSGSLADLKHLRTQFDQNHYVHLPEFLGKQFLDIIRRRISQAAFYERVHEGIGSNKELCMRNDFVSSLFHFLLNGYQLFRLVQEITGCDRIGSFEGRVYRIISGHGHLDAWHNDLVDHRLVAISINLSEEAYSGGILQIRDRRSRQIIHQVTNVGAGDAILFRLAPHLEHRITEVEGSVPKTAFAGWFKSQPDFLSMLKAQSRPKQEGSGVIAE